MIPPPPKKRTHSYPVGILAAGFIVAGATSCTDRNLPVEPNPPASSAALTAQDAQTRPQTGGDIPTLRRFDVAVAASGTFRPGAPITLQLRVTGLTDVTNAELHVALPEVSAAIASDWGAGFRYLPVDEPVGSVLRHTFDVRRGVSSEFLVTVEVPAEGYYQVVTTLRAPEDTPIVEGGQWALNTSVDERWLLITEAGGELTSTFEPDRIPASYLKEGGPFRSSRTPVSRRNPADADANRSGPSVEDAAAGGTTRITLFDDITYQIKFYDDDAESYQPLPHAYFIVYLCDRPPQQFICEPEDFEQYDSGGADANGYVTFPCLGDEYILEVSTFRPGRFRVNYGAVEADGDIDSDCGSSFEQTLQSTRAQIFKNLYAAVNGTLTLFGEARSFIDVWEDADNNLHKSYYDPSEDEIHILTAHVWTSQGASTAAHEYGHAFHEDALLGDMGSGNCPGKHYLDTETGLLCAFSEGFADYFGAATRPDLTGQAAYFENDNAFPGCVSRDSSGQCTGGTSYEGSVIEGAFAAFLYDLTDSGVEPHDSIAAPGSYVADLVRTCKIYYPSVGGWYRANGADDVSYCAENVISPGSCFTVRGWSAQGFQEGADEPASWTGGRVNAMWRWNMYEKPDSTVSC